MDERLIDTVAQVASEDARSIPDIHASEEYKKELVRVLVQQTLKDAMARAAAHS